MDVGARGKLPKRYGFFCKISYALRLRFKQIPYRLFFRCTFTGPDEPIYEYGPSRVEMAKLAFQFQIDLIKAGKNTTDGIFYSKFKEVVLQDCGPLWDSCLEAPLDEEARKFIIRQNFTY